MQEIIQPAGLVRLAMSVEYAGSRYKGWQKQNSISAATVQGTVESAISFVANHEVSTVCAGRTDSGVHGSGQVIHFDTHAKRNLRGWLLGVNTHLPDDISIQWVKPVSQEFHARFSAQARRYRYVIYQGPVKPAILSQGLTWTHKTLDVVRMQNAAACLIGTHDFSGFRAQGCQANTPIRTISNLEVSAHGRFIVIDVTANAFLYHMIRNIAGVLMTIGASEADVEWCQKVLDGKNRKEGGITAPPQGLYFVGVQYPEEFGLPLPPAGPEFLSALMDFS